MATSNQRDVKLGVEIQAAGEENLQRLAVEVRALAKAGGDAAPLYNELANELDRVAVQARELDAFKRAAAGIDEATAATKRAIASAEQLRTAYNEQAAATETVRSAQASIQQTLDQTRRSIADQVLQQKLLDQSFKDGKVEAVDYEAAGSKLAISLANLKARAAGLAIDLRDAKAATKESADALRDAANASLSADRASESLSTQLRAQVSAIEAAATAGAKLGADFGDVAAAQERLDATLRSGVAALEARAAAEQESLRYAAALAEMDDQAAQAARRLADSVEYVSKAYAAEAAAAAEAARANEVLAAATRATEAATLRAAEAEASRVAKLREQADADRDAARVAQGLAELRKRGAEALQAELAAQRDAEASNRAYTAGLTRQAAEQAAASAEALRYVEALDASAAAADKASRRSAELNAQAAKTEQAARYVRELAAAFDAADAQATKVAADVQRLSGYFDKLGAQRDVLKSAFGTTGVRSIQEIEREMFNLSGALVTLRAEFSAGRISVADFERATSSAGVRLAALKTEIATIPGSSTVFEGLARGANDLITKFGALGAAVATVGFAVKPVIDSFIALESTTRILTQVAGGAEAAAKQISFLRTVSQQSGLAFSDISKSYAQFAASALQAGLSTEQVQLAFKNVSLAAGNLGLSTDQAKRALEALSQMASKGTVSMEELRQQLGDALPGVFPLLAKELGVTTQELGKIVEAGGLVANDAIPAIAAALTKLGPANGEVKGLVATWTRFKDTVLQAGTAIVDGPLGTAAGVVLTGLAGAIRDIAFVAVSASEGIRLIGTTIGVTAAAIAGGKEGFKDFGATMQAETLKSAQRLEEFKRTAYGTGEGVRTVGDAFGTLAETMVDATPAAEALTASNAALATTTQAAAGASQAAAVQHTAAAAAVTQAGTSAAASAVQQTAVAQAVEQVGQAASTSGTKLLRLAADYDANIAVAERLQAVSTKLAQARKDEGVAVQALADLLGTEAASRTAAAQVAAANAAALKDEADANRAVLEIMKAKRAALEQQAIIEGKLTAERKTQLAGLDALIEKEAASVEKTKQAAAAATVQAEATRLSSESLKDNTTRIGEFRKATDAARLAVQATAIEMSYGRATSDELAAATARLNSSLGLERDAYLDANRASQTYVEFKRAETTLITAGLQVRLEEAKTLLRSAELHGLDAQATQAKIQIKRVELEQQNALINAKRVEAEETIRATEATMRELESINALTPEKRNELELRVLAAKAKVSEAQAGKEATKQIEEEIRALQGLTSAKRSAAGGSALTNPDGTYRTSTTVGGIGPAPAPGAVDAYGRTQAQVDRLAGQNSVDATQQFDLLQRAARGQVTAADLPFAQQVLAVLQQNSALERGNAGAVSFAGLQSRTVDYNRALQAVQQAQQAAGVGAPTPTAAPAPRATPSGATGNRTFTINFGGQTSQITDLTTGQQSQIEDFIARLSAASTRAGG